MSSNNDPRKMAVLSQQEIPYRVRWYLLGVYPGAGRVKRISRELDVSLRKAERLLAGESVTTADLQAMAKRYGRSFIDFIFAPLAIGGSDDFSVQAWSLRARAHDLDAASADGPLGVRPGAVGVLRAAVAGEPSIAEARPRVPGDRRSGPEEAPAGDRGLKAAQ